MQTLVIIYPNYSFGDLLAIKNSRYQSAVFLWLGSGKKLCGC
jgi:hypothetical protein